MNLDLLSSYQYLYFVFFFENSRLSFKYLVFSYERKYFLISKFNVYINWRNSIHLPCNLNLWTLAKKLLAPWKSAKYFLILIL